MVVWQPSFGLLVIMMNGSLVSGVEALVPVDKALVPVGPVDEAFGADLPLEGSWWKKAADLVEEVPGESHW